MSNINWNSEDFLSLPEEKREVLRNIIEEASSIKPEASIAYLSKLSSTLKENNLFLTPSEKEIVISHLLNNMSTEEKSKFGTLKNLLSR